MRAAAADKLFTSKGKVKGYVLLADCLNCLIKRGVRSFAVC